MNGQYHDSHSYHGKVINGAPSSDGTIHNPSIMMPGMAGIHVQGMSAIPNMLGMNMMYSIGMPMNGMMPVGVHPQNLLAQGGMIPSQGGIMLPQGNMLYSAGQHNMPLSMNALGPEYQAMLMNGVRDSNMNMNMNMSMNMMLPPSELPLSNGGMLYAAQLNALNIDYMAETAKKEDINAMHARILSRDVEEDDDDGDGTDMLINENTGRWTREEHHLFLKGLELHGKGWKKIASLIKTRTVVQIRTHAQKYFLKLQKARQGGDGNGMLVEGKSLFGCRKRRKRRLQDRPVCLPLHLKPFFGISSEGSAAVELGDKDIDEGLYNFLSPMFEATSSACTSLETPNAAESSSVQQTSDAHLLTMGVMARPPEWYQRGYHVDKLLQDAEALDWNADSGEAVTQPLSKRSLQPRIVVDAKTAGSQTISPNLASDVSKQAQSSQSDGWDTSISQECFSELLGTFTETTEEIRVAAPRNTVGEVSAGAIDTEGDRLRARTGTSDVSPLEVQLGKSLQGRAEVWDTHLTSDTFSDLVMHAYYVDEEDLVTAKSENNETEK